jgi:hypothetical protein
MVEILTGHGSPFARRERQGARPSPLFGVLVGVSPQPMSWQPDATFAEKSLWRRRRG